MAVVRTAIPKGVDAESESLRPVAMRAWKKVALFAKILMMVWMGLLRVMGVLLLLGDFVVVVVLLTHAVARGGFNGRLSRAVARTVVARVALELWRSTSRHILVRS